MRVQSKLLYFFSGFLFLISFTQVYNIEAADYINPSKNLSSRTNEQETIIQGIIKMHDSGALDADPESKAKALEVKKSYEHKQILKKKVEAQQEHIAILEEMESINSIQPEKDDYDAIVNRGSKVLQLPKIEVVRMIEKGDPRIKKIFDKMVKEEYEKLYNEVKAARLARKHSNNRL